MTVGDALRANARRQPWRLCLADERRRFTYGEVNARVNRVADSLLRAGARPGDAIAIYAKNSIEYLELFHVCAKVQLRLVTLNHWHRAAEFERLFIHSEATWLVVDDATQDRAAEALPRLRRLSPARVVTLGTSTLPGAVSWDLLEAGGDDREPDVTVDDAAPFWMMYTSGTTGDPKGLVRSHRRTAVCLWHTLIEFAFQPDDAFLAVSPFFHGVAFFPLMVLQRGGSVHVVREFAADRVLELIERERITSSFLVPTMLDILREHPRFEHTCFDSLRIVVTGAAPMPTVVKETIFRVMGPVLYEFYGASESGFLTVLHPRDQLRKERCCGAPCFGAEIEIRGESGLKLLPEAVGEVFSRCGGRFDGYYKDARLTEQALHGEWFTAGDLGRLDDEGFLYIVDRKGDLVISGGENVYPREIEDVLRTHPAIAECAVIGVPDERWGEVVMAVVVRATNASLGAAEVVAYCVERLAGFKRPRHVAFVTELPKNASGKVLKTELRTRMASFAEGVRSR